MRWRAPRNRGRVSVRFWVAMPNGGFQVKRWKDQVKPGLKRRDDRCDQLTTCCCCYDSQGRHWMASVMDAPLL